MPETAADVPAAKRCEVFVRKADMAFVPPNIFAILTVSCRLSMVTRNSQTFWLPKYVEMLFFGMVSVFVVVSLIVVQFWAPAALYSQT